MFNRLPYVIFLVFSLLIPVLFCGGCGSGGGSTGGAGGSSVTGLQGGDTSRIVITFENPGYQKSCFSLRSYGPKTLPSTTKKITVRLTNASTGQQVQEAEPIIFDPEQPTASTSFNNVPSGTYQVLVAAYDSSGNLVGEGKSPVTVQASAVQTVSVEVQPVVPLPAISSIVPVSGPPGTALTIMGANFGASQGSGVVTFGGNAIAEVASWGDTAIVAVVPDTAATGIVTVKLENGQTAQSTQQFAVVPPQFEGEIIAVCNEGDATISLIDSKTNKMLKKVIFSVDQGTVTPHCVDFTPSGDKMVFTNPAGSSVMVNPTSAFLGGSSNIAFNGLKIIFDSVSPPPTPYEVTMRPNTSGDGQGYITFHTNKWGVVDTLNNKGILVNPGPLDIIEDVPLLTPSIAHAAFDSTGTYAYLVGNDTDRIPFIIKTDRASNDILDKKIIRDTGIVGGLKLENVMAQVTPDDSRLFIIAGTFNPTIGGIAYYTPLPAFSFSFQQKVLVGSKPSGMAILPNGSKMYVVNSDSNSVSVINMADTAVISTISGQETGFNMPVQAAAHPGGNRVYVTNKGGNSVSVIDTATDTVIKVIPVGQTPFGISVAPRIL